MAKINTRVTLRTPQAAALIKAASNEALTDMGLQALQDASKHVPHDQGDLEGSGLTNSDKKAKNGKFVMKWEEPYSQYLLDAFDQALALQDARLEIRYKQGPANGRGYVLLKAVPITDHSSNIELNEDGSVKLNILDYQNGVNHLICLGAGEVEQRQQVDLYAWPDGSIRKEQYYTGIDLIEQYYENTTVDTLAELEEEGRDKFDELKNYKQLKISVDDTDLELGDIVGGRERITNIYMAAPVIRKIVDVTGRGRTSISYKLKGEE